MIEKTVLDFLSERLEAPVYMEIPEKRPPRFVILEKTGGGDEEKTLSSSTLAIQSYAESLYRAAALNQKVINAMRGLAPARDAVTRCALNSSYNFTETGAKEYRYQAVFNLIHYVEDFDNAQ